MDDQQPSRRRYVAVIGAGDADRDTVTLAEEVGRLIAASGAVLVCGGLGGVMEAAARGAKRAGGTTVGILPGHDRGAANPFLDVVVTTGIGEARNLAVVSSGDAVIAVGGQFGTLSEIGLAAKIGRPVVLLHSWHVALPGIDVTREGLPGIRVAETPREAVALAMEAQPPSAY
jgi:uncharacterized protein (TIGR00725 family)